MKDPARTRDIFRRPNRCSCCHAIASQGSYSHVARDYGGVVTGRFYAVVTCMSSYCMSRGLSLAREEFQAYYGARAA